ncbi:hypothetical protein VTN02DRAFT_6243 [Thermoascus thermophilus]
MLALPVEHPKPFWKQIGRAQALVTADVRAVRAWDSGDESDLRWIGSAGGPEAVRIAQQKIVGRHARDRPLRVEVP